MTPTTRPTAQVLEEQGFLILEGFLSPEQCQHLHALASLHSRAPGTANWGVRCSSFSRDSAYRTETEAVLLESVRSRLPLAALPNHEALTAQWVVNDPGGAGTPLHRDPSLVDEVSGLRSYGLWIPVTNATRETGVLGVAPGSHRSAPHRRWLDGRTWVRDLDPDPPTYYPDLAAGSAILHDHRLAHCSSPNRSELPRIAFLVALLDAAPEVCRPSPDLSRVVSYGMTRKDLRETHPYTPTASLSERRSEPIPARERLHLFRLLRAKSAPPPDRDSDV